MVEDHVHFVLTDVSPGRYKVPVKDIDEEEDDASLKFIKEINSLGLCVINKDKHIIPFGGKTGENKNTANLLVKVQITNLAEGLFLKGIGDVFNNIHPEQALKFYKLVNKLQELGFFQKMDIEFYSTLEELRSFGKGA
jgi:hypothetical protein